ncbi:hypothetical protein [Nocardia huaxiensis]|uniref:Uncharacterized protein n=1 Tax=Nocardia huaxiensis TaxID=2755382 RepID=A0A7D6VDK5_9NOCA|nr:hypothetical protein [Nocardia huaxiensis]QLY32854.1 hypothetical protein H0264_11930 [Nocardia huaxiensis]UFS93391.1 hypothetical protein LPY97_21415 [Nocardia huaxiensis]
MSTGGRPLARPVFPFVDAMVVIDLPDRRVLVDEPRIEEWGIGAGEVFEIALQNFMQAIIVPTEKDSPIRFVDHGDGYFTSLLLIPGWLSLFSDGEHRPVAFIPDERNLILLQDKGDGVEKMFALVAEEYLGSDCRVSPQAYTVDENHAVIPYDRAEPLSVAARSATAQLALTGYSTQTTFLEHILDENPDALSRRYGIEYAYPSDIFDAEPAGLPATIIPWCHGTASLLPDADYLDFCEVDSNGQITGSITAPLRLAVETLGLAPVPGLWPRRFEAREWPDDATLAQLAASVNQRWRQ